MPWKVEKRQFSGMRGKLAFAGHPYWQFSLIRYALPMAIVLIKGSGANGLPVKRQPVSDGYRDAAYLVAGARELKCGPKWRHLSKG